MIVGTAPNQLEFTFYYKVVAKRSGFFRKCERSTEEESTLAVFHDHDPSTFDLYMDFLYDGILSERPYPEALQLFEDSRSYERTEEDVEKYDIVRRTFLDSRYKELVKLYALADHLLDPAAVNEAIDEIRTFMEECSWTPSTEILNLVWRSTKKKDDGLRLVFADFFMFKPGHMHRLDPELPKEVFILIAERCACLEYQQQVVLGEEFAKDFGSGTGIGRWEDYQHYYREDLEDSWTFEDLD